MNLKKKICSAVLAGVMTLSLAVPAFAAGMTEDDPNRLAVTKATEFEIEMEGEVYTPVIRVQVASKGAKVYLNPSKGKIAGTVGGFKEGTTDVPVAYEFDGQGIASTPIIIRSDSDNGLTVNANVTVTAPKTVTLQDTTIPTTGVTTKQAFVQAAGTTALTDKSSVAKLTMDSFTKITLAKGGVITASGKSQAVASVATIAAAKQSDGKIIPQYGAVMLCGTCTKAGDVQWTEDDALTATVVLTFSGVSA